MTVTNVQGQTTYTVVLGIADPHQAMVIQREIDRHPRFTVVQDAPNAVLTVDSATQLQPDLVILSDLSPGVQGRHVLGDLEFRVPSARVIITVAGDPSIAKDAANVAYAIDDHDPAAMLKALDSTAESFDHPDEQPERRHSFDRRLHQDWTKVFSERRVSVRRASSEEPQRLEMPYLN